MPAFETDALTAMSDTGKPGSGWHRMASGPRVSGGRASAFCRPREGDEGFTTAILIPLVLVPCQWLPGMRSCLKPSPPPNDQDLHQDFPAERPCPTGSTRGRPATRNLRPSWRLTNQFSDRPSFPRIRPACLYREPGSHPRPQTEGLRRI